MRSTTSDMLRAFAIASAATVLALACAQAAVNLRLRRPDDYRWPVTEQPIQELRGRFRDA